MQVVFRILSRLSLLGINILLYYCGSPMKGDVHTLAIRYITNLVVVDAQSTHDSLLLERGYHWSFNACMITKKSMH